MRVKTLPSRAPTACLNISPQAEGFVPAGGNVVMLDGHVQWRNFSEMKLRTSSAQTLYYW
jgi:prepilin-type processing-associated H-X9-DG protein